MGCCGDFGIQSRGKRATSGHKCRLCVIWHIIKGDGVPGGDPCVVIPGHVIDKPDPCIYDQFLLMQLNEPVTWDNPDVRIFLNGVEQYTYNLTVATEYDVEITVHNSSRNRPATGTSVAVRWIEFGAGGQIRHPIATLTANVPTWPSSRVVATKWTTPAAPGHYCIEVELAQPDDGNPSNNRGWNNTQVYAAHSPATLPIRIFNTQPGDCPPVSEGGGPVLRPHRIFLGWGPIGAVIALLLQDRLAEHVPRSLAFLTLLAAGYVTLSVVGLFCESAAVWMKQRSNIQAGSKARADRTAAIWCTCKWIPTSSPTVPERISTQPQCFRGIPPSGKRRSSLQASRSCRGKPIVMWNSTCKCQTAPGSRGISMSTYGRAACLAAG